MAVHHGTEMYHQSTLNFNMNYFEVWMQLLQQRQQCNSITMKNLLKYFFVSKAFNFQFIRIYHVSGNWIYHVSGSWLLTGTAKLNNVSTKITWMLTGQQLKWINWPLPSLGTFLSKYQLVWLANLSVKVHWNPSQCSHLPLIPFIIVVAMKLVSVTLVCKADWISRLSLGCIFGDAWNSKIGQFRGKQLSNEKRNLWLHAAAMTTFRNASASPGNSGKGSLPKNGKKNILEIRY